MFKALLRFILTLTVILIIFLPNIISQELDLPPFWRSPIYKDVLVALQEYGFTNQEIDSMFYAADSGRKEFLKRKEEKEQLKQMYRFGYIHCYPWLPDSIIDKKVREQLGEKEPLELLSKESIQLGKKFLKEHKKELVRLEKKYDVPKEILVAILRVETCFGANLGQHHVFHVFDEIISSMDVSDDVKNWFKQEMVALFIICRENNLDVSRIMGSWSGAIGLVQFMPTSYLKFAVDGNKDGIINLFEMEDALPSAANYLKKAGWRKSNFIQVNKRAIWFYNRHWGYVNDVITYAQKIGFKY